MVEVLLKIHLSAEDDINVDIELRYLLADTIEEWGWASVAEEGTGESGFELYLNIEKVNLKNSKKEIIQLVKALGFLKYEFIV